MPSWCWRTSSATSRRSTSRRSKPPSTAPARSSLAVMATTLSLVVIFLPVAFMTGYARRYINPFGWTMAFSIMVSMLVSFTLTPMLSSRFLKVPEHSHDDQTREGGFFHWIDTFYARSVAWSLDHQWTIIAISVAVFLTTFPLNRMIGRDLRAQRGHGRVDHPYRHPGRHLARRQHRDRHESARRAERRAGCRHAPAVDHRAADPHPFPRLCRAVRPAIGQPGRDRRGAAPPARCAPGLQTEHHGQESARWRRTGRVRDFGEHPRRPI